MSAPASSREVRLVDGRLSSRPLVRATLIRDYPVELLDLLEIQWQQAREQAATTGGPEDAFVMEHAHWDWRNKSDSVAAGRRRLMAIECDGAQQGIMAVLTAPRPARLADAHLLYVDYLESAPWNLKSLCSTPRFLGVGTVLMAEAIRLSLEWGLKGRVGLHSLPQAEIFYSRRCKMQAIGPDPHYFGLTYFEYTDQQAADWLTGIGEQS